jgi:aryl-alcohol dehydrogenase-like predicted oxidoreductase
MTKLQRRNLGATGLSVAPIGLAGSWGIEADEVERAYHELGVNYFFVTPRMKGLVEGIRRLVDGGHRDDIVIAAGAAIPTGGRVIAAHKKLSKLLGVETIDVFHLFWIQAKWYVTGKTWPAMRELKSSGRARSLAVSIHDRKMARRLVDELDLDVLMCRYNAAHRGAEREIFSDLPEDRPAIVAYTATRWGKLLKSAGELGPMTPPECYRFVLSHPRVGVVLCGASSFAELSADVAAVQRGPLEDERMEEVRLFGDRVRATATGRIGFVGP